MKRNRLLTVGVLTLLALASITLVFSGQNVDATVMGTKHDIGYAPDPDDAGPLEETPGSGCKSCHVPHNAIISTDAPLWRQTLTTQTFVTYPTGGTMNATDVTTPTGPSKLCLSCHDGATTILATAAVMTGTNKVGLDLKGSHPVSFTYDSDLATADGELVNPSSADSSGLGSTISADMLFGASNDQLECASCHDPHDDTNSKFLIMDNGNSELCLTCHSK